MAVGIVPSYVCQPDNWDLESGSVAAWGLDASKQLAAGQVVTAPVVKVYDTDAGGADVTAAMLVGSPTVGPNAAGVAGTTVIVVLQAAVAGHSYDVVAHYVPSPPSPSQELLPLVSHMHCQR